MCLRSGWLVAFTTLYLAATAALAPPFTPSTVRGAWDDAAGAVVRMLDPTKRGLGVTTTNGVAEVNASGTWDVLLFRGVSGPLDAQTISGTVDAIIRVQEANADADFVWHVHIYITEGDTDTVRGTLLSDWIGTTEWPTSFVGRAFDAPQTLTNIGAITAGDRMVVEIGYRATNTHTTSRVGNISTGTMGSDGQALADLTVGGGTGAPFLVFSNAINDLAAGSARVSQVAVEYVRTAEPHAQVSQVAIEAVIIARDAPPGGGEVPPGDDPAVADLPVGVIRPFVRFTLGAAPPYTQFAVAETPLRDPASWYHGFKSPSLLQVGTVERELADTVRATQVRLELADADRRFRTLATTATLGGAFVEIFVVADTVRYALGEPYRLFAGYIGEHRALPGFRYEIVLDDALASELARLGEAPRIPPDKLSIAQFPGMTAQYEGRAVPIVLGEANDENEPGPGDVDVIHGTTTPQGVIPPVILAPRINLQGAFGGIDLDVIAAIFSQGALAANGLWTVYFNTVDDPYTRIPVPFSAWGTILFTPGMPGWASTGLATDYADYPLPPGATTRRYTPIFIAADFPPYSQAVLDGRVLIAANVFGVTEDPEGAGEYFSDAPRIYQWLLANFLYGRWMTGLYLDMPHFPGADYSIINTDSVATSTTRLRAFGGGAYPVGFMLGRGGEQQSLRHILEELCAGVLMEQGIDRHGRLMLDVEDPEAAATHRLSDLHDIEDGQFEVWVDRSAYVNRLEFVHGFRYLPAIAPLPTPAEGEVLPVRPTPPFQEWSSGLRVLEDATAIAANQGRVVTQFAENYVVRSSAVGGSWASRKLQRGLGPLPTLDGPRMFRLLTSWQALAVELGDVIEMDHGEGLGASGFEGQRGRVLKISVDPMRARITLEGRLLYAEAT